MPEWSRARDLMLAQKITLAAVEAEALTVALDAGYVTTWID